MLINLLWERHIKSLRAYQK